ncbi:putative plant non-specific lipid-transfer protein/Par allergen [Helianthus debilis subsp. tardiflorus]
MAASMLMKMACVVVACMVVLAPHAEAALTCGTVVSSLIPCLPYLRSGGMPSPSCCGGVKRLNGAANNSADRKTACGCLKNAYSSNPGINSGNAASLPSKCGVNIPYKISPNTDCSKYVFIIKNTHKYNLTQ